MVADAVSVAPHVYKVLLENDRVRVLESRMTPGATSEMHSHPDMVITSVTPGKYKFTTPDGQSMESDVPVNQPMYMDGSAHSTENIGTVEGQVFLIELK